MSLSKMQTGNNSKKQLFHLFITSCQDNELDKVKACVLLGVDVNIVSEDGQWSGLTIAAHKKFPQLLDLLLSQPGIDVNLATVAESVTGRSWGNWTPLLFACQAGHQEMVRRLLLQAPGAGYQHPTQR